MNVTFNFKGYTAVITGAGSGIGQGIAVRFAQAGANVVVADLSEAGGMETVKRCAAYGGQVEFIKTNVGVEADCKALIQSSIDRFGKIDILVCGAGVSARGITGNPITGTSESDFDICYRVNLMGLYFPAKAVYDHFVQRHFGKIVTVASIAGTHASPHLAHYSASKAAAIQLAKILAIELGPHNVNVNAICPGFVDTAMYEKALPQYIEKYPKLFNKDTKAADVCRIMAENNCASRRPQTVDNMADAVLFLSSEGASEWMGQIIEVSGGFKL